MLQNGIFSSNADRLERYTRAESHTRRVQNRIVRDGMDSTIIIEAEEGDDAIVNQSRATKAECNGLAPNQIVSNEDIDSTVSSSRTMARSSTGEAGRRESRPGGSLGIDSSVTVSGESV
jgi:hypothetical protein